MGVSFCNVIVKRPSYKAFIQKKKMYSFDLVAVFFYFYTLALMRYLQFSACELLYLREWYFENDSRFAGYLIVLGDRLSRTDTTHTYTK